MPKELNIPELVNTLNTLMEEYDEVSKEANFWYLRLIGIKNKIYNEQGKVDHSVKKELDETTKKADHWRDRKDKLYSKIEDIKTLLYWEIPPIKTDGVIDLRKNNMTKEKEVIDRYDICLHGTKEIIGVIQYGGYHYSKMGDIGYSVYTPYQGHHYAYRALCLMTELLYVNGIEDFWITAKNDNLASIKTMQRYGVEVVEKLDDKYTLYQGSTTKKEELEAGLKV